MGSNSCGKHYTRRTPPRSRKSRRFEDSRDLGRSFEFKGKGKARTKYAQKVPAEIIKVSDNKDYLFKVLKGEDEETPSKQGKGQRKRVVNSKYAWQSDVDEENTHVVSKRLKTGCGIKQESEKRNVNLIKMIKDKYKKTKKSNKFIESDSSDDEKPPNSEITDQLLRENKALKDENARLRQELHNIEDMKTCIRKLKRHVCEIAQEGKPARKGIPAINDQIVENEIQLVPKKNLCGASTTLKDEDVFPGIKREYEVPPSPQSQNTNMTSPLQKRIFCEASPNMRKNNVLPESSEIKRDIYEVPQPPQSQNTNMITLGPSLVVPAKILNLLKTRRVGSYVANIMGATLSREHMATHTLRGQKAKNGGTKPKLDAVYIKSLIDHALSVTYTDMKRQVLEEDVVKAIKFKLNNEESAWKKHSSVKEEQKENIEPQNNDNEN